MAEDISNWYDTRGDVETIEPSVLKRWNELATSYRGAGEGGAMFAEPARYNIRDVPYRPRQGAFTPGEDYQGIPQRAREGTFSVLGGPGGGGAGGVGPQVTNLAQLQQVMQVLGKSGLPPELRDMLFSRLTGIPFRSDRQVALENALSQVRQKHQLEAPMKEAEFGRRMEEMAGREEARGETRDYRQEMLRMREEAMQGQRASQLKALHDIGQASTDPNVKAAISQMVLKALSQMGGGQAAQGEQPPLAAPRASGGITIRRIR